VNPEVEVDGSGDLCWNPCFSSEPTTKGGLVEPLPDLGSLSDSELKSLIDDLQAQEDEVSFQRRMLHGKIDILRAELVARLQKSGGESVLEQVDVDRLTDILTGKGAPPA
jgi:anti-sigma-K factor RsiG